MDPESEVTYYAILEVSENASLAEIKKAFRRLANEYHPDRLPPELRDRRLGRDALEAFQQISEAYEVLSVADRRLAYDQQLASYRSEFAGPQTFSQDPARQGSQAPPPPPPPSQPPPSQPPPPQSPSGPSANSQPFRRKPSGFSQASPSKNGRRSVLLAIVGFYVGFFICMPVSLYLYRFLFPNGNIAFELLVVPLGFAGAIGLARLFYRIPSML